MKFEVNQWDDFFEAKVIGALDLAGFESLFSTLFTQDMWVPDSKILYDLSELDASNMNADQMIDIIDLCEMWRDETGRGRCAFVVPEKDQFHFARMFMRRTMFKWDVEMEAFSEKPDAMYWLMNKPHLYFSLDVDKYKGKDEDAADPYIHWL